MSTAAFGQITLEEAKSLSRGWLHPLIQGVAVDFRPDKNKYHHVLSNRGQTIFVGDPVQYQERDPRDGEKNVRWKLAPDSPEKLKGTPDHPIVVIGDSARPYHSIETSKIALSDQEIRQYVRGLSLPADVPRDAVNVQVLDAGSGDGRVRLIMLIENDEAPITGPTKVTVSIAEIGKNRRLGELFTYVRRHEGQDLFVILDGMADLDRDGLADVFLINHGDFPGHTFVIGEGGRWRQEDLPGKGI
jgi:hypothetical protein